MSLLFWELVSAEELCCSCYSTSGTGFGPLQELLRGASSCAPTFDPSCILQHGHYRQWFRDVWVIVQMSSYYGS